MAASVGCRAPSRNTSFSGFRTPTVYNMAPGLSSTAAGLRDKPFVPRPVSQRSPHPGHPTHSAGQPFERSGYSVGRLHRGRRLNATNSDAESLCRVIRVTYLRPDGRAAGFGPKKWGLHVWGSGAKQETAWDAPMTATGQVSDGCFWDVPIQAEGEAELGFIVHSEDNKSAGGDQPVIVQPTQQEIWLVDGHQAPCLTREEAAMKAIGSLQTASAHWVSRDVILWRKPTQKEGVTKCSFALHASSSAEIRITSSTVDGADHTFPLVPHEDPESTTDIQDALRRFPYLQGCTALRFQDAIDPGTIAELVKVQLCVSAADDGAVSSVTGMQIAGLLDTEFFYDGKLGDVDGRLTVWAPTAQSMQLLHYTDCEAGEPAVHHMQKGPQGTWTISRPAEWDKQYFLLRLKVFHYATQQIEEVLVTDPYSRCLSADGRRSMFVDLCQDTSLMPAGWQQHASPAINDAIDTSVYELHVRDFSACDDSVPDALRGKYIAFDSSATGATTRGQQHLLDLAGAGLTHVHLLPSYDFGSVPEKPEEQLTVEMDLAQFAADGQEQQAEVSRIAAEDAFNWGYDPVHYGVPEGSYATDPDSADRVLEYRQMVKGLHDSGLRVVQDVVYNHTFASGLDRYSVLDKVVPGYYHRRTESGKVCDSTCCNNTATEHLMAERLMIDDLVHWATHYRIDGFRFDIMGHIMVSSMKKAQAALAALTVQEHGVDGRSIYLYGEAWDFGECAGNQRGRNACQVNISGTGLGAFNDRFRDAAMGGSPFGDPTLQGFLTGLYSDPCPPAAPNSNADDLQCLASYKTLLKLSMAANLRDYVVTLPDGSRKRGAEVRYGHFPAAYCKLPQENVLYLGCHDNEALYDQAVLKVNHGGEAEACKRVVELALGLIGVSQGVAFFHAGDDLLRSKSLDRDSYNSGDWFNKLLWDGSSNNFGVGLPVASKNADTWALKRPFLGMPGLKATPAQIQETREFQQAVLRLRYSSPLFRLPNAEAVIEQVTFVPQCEEASTLVMVINSSDEHVRDPQYSSICVMLNASPSEVAVQYPPSLTALSVHPEFEGLPHVAGCTVNDDDKTVMVSPRTILVLCQPH